MSAHKALGSLSQVTQAQEDTYWEWGGAGMLNLTGYALLDSFILF